MLHTRISCFQMIYIVVYVTYTNLRCDGKKVSKKKKKEKIEKREKHEMRNKQFFKLKSK